MWYETTIAAATLLLAASAPPGAAEEDTAASIVLERNFSEQEAEALITLETEDLGLAELAVVGPDGRTLASFGADGPGNLGWREFQLESPEPADITQVLAAYPEGTYRFIGRDVAGGAFMATAQLSHALPLPTVPRLDGTLITWDAVDSAVKYVVEIENDDQGLAITVELPAGQTSLRIPAGWLADGVEYELGLAVVNAAGNLMVVETEFETAASP